MIYLVPANTAEGEKNNNTKKTLSDNYNKINDNDTYISAYENGTNYVSNKLKDGSNGGFLKSNDKVAKNLPYVVGCNNENTYMCSVTVELPNPIGGGTRNDDTFVFVVALPYGGPSTKFALEFLCADSNGSCFTITNSEGETIEREAELYNVQIKVDSTGRANTLYKRVEARLEPADEFSLSTLGPLEILGDGNDGLKKDFYTTCEYDFDPTCS